MTITMMTASSSAHLSRVDAGKYVCEGGRRSPLASWHRSPRATGTHGYLLAAAPAKPSAIDFTSEFHADCDADTSEITEFMML